MLCVLSHHRKISQCWCGLILFWWFFFSPIPLWGLSALMNNGSKSQNLLLSSLHVPWGCLTQGNVAFMAVGGSSAIFPPFHLPALSAATFHHSKSWACVILLQIPFHNHLWGGTHGKWGTKKPGKWAVGFFPPNSVGPIYFQFYYM